MHIIEKLIPKITQYEEIQYVGFYHLCPQCRRSGTKVGLGSLPYQDDFWSKPNLIGFCETESGLMIVLECPECFCRYRHHIYQSDRFNLDKFKEKLFKKYICKKDGYCQNSRELYNKGVKLGIFRDTKEIDLFKDCFRL